MKTQKLLTLLLALLLTACSTFTPWQKELPKVVTTSTPKSVDALSPTMSPKCISAFQHRELKEPYQRINDTDDVRYTLSTEELNTYWSAMGIETLCIPVTLGAPFVNVDWNRLDGMPVVGRMISIGFEDLEKRGWSRGFILYATYDFSMGTEYETFADRKDLDAVRQGVMADMIKVDGVNGFIRIKQSNYCFGKCTAYKTYVFPFEKYYVAVVYDLGAYEYDANWEAIIQGIREGKYPPETQSDVAEFDLLVSTIQFQH
jgi:hypothetical protein